MATESYSKYAYYGASDSSNGAYFQRTVTVTSDSDTLSAGDTVTVTITNGTTTVVSATMTYVGTTSSGSPVFYDADNDTYYAVSDSNSVAFSDTNDLADSNYDTTETYTLCFAAGTLIATPDGDVAVETLQPGDLVLTASGATTRVVWLGRQTQVKLFSQPEQFCPVRIAAGALAENVPATDLSVTVDHGIVFAEAVVHAGALVNGTTITRTPKSALPDRLTWYHVETEDHAVILANGCPAETFIDNAGRERFDNFDEFLALTGGVLPVLKPLDLPRATGARQVPAAIRSRIAARAEELNPVSLAG